MKREQINHNIPLGITRVSRQDDAFEALVRAFDPENRWPTDEVEVNVGRLSEIAYRIQVSFSFRGEPTIRFEPLFGIRTDTVSINDRAEMTINGLDHAMRAAFLTLHVERKPRS